MSGPVARYVATGSEPLAALLERTRHAQALADGRVFIDGKRAAAGSTLPPAGSIVEVYAERSIAETVRILAMDR